MRCFTHRPTSMRFHERALRSSCGCALQIFPASMPNNILVIEISTRSNVSFADLIGEAICRGEHRARVKIAAACIYTPIDRRVAYRASLARAGDSPDTLSSASWYRSVRRVRRPPMMGQAVVGNVISATVCGPEARLSSTDLPASIPRDYVSVIGDQAFWRF